MPIFNLENGVPGAGRTLVFGATAVTGAAVVLAVGAAATAPDAGVVDADGYSWVAQPSNPEARHVTDNSLAILMVDFIEVVAPMWNSWWCLI
ncbi:hypothetical protein [Acidithiobacillus ferrivorans]|uniref:hypothetical protein n=1 Tax=Acidithiobacillus ferrivorans TaxID=160808 RepID=UPI000554E002|nr:hypothetical protein [Acidithiobacillus ferrivorans]